MPGLVTTPAPEGALDAADADLQAALDDQLAGLQRRATHDNNRHASPEERLRRQCEAIAKACGEDPRTDQPYHTTEDVLGWVARAVELGCGLPRMGPDTVRRVFKLEIVPNAHFREAYLRTIEEDEDATAFEIARAVTGEDNPRMDDFDRLLGIAPQTAGRGTLSLRLFVDYEVAVRLADALDLDYHDCGL